MRLKISSSWVAFLIFYAAVMAVVVIIDWSRGNLVISYWGLQALLVTVGVGIFALVGAMVKKITPEYSVLLAFTVGVLTIIPAILMGLDGQSGFWPTYFSIALGMSAGSFLGFLFVRLVRRLPKDDDFE